MRYAANLMDYLMLPTKMQLEIVRWVDPKDQIWINSERAFIVNVENPELLQEVGLRLYQQDDDGQWQRA